jgi:hypothetical protein
MGLGNRVTSADRIILLALCAARDIVSDEVNRAVNASLIPSRLAAESLNSGLKTIDELIALGQRNDHCFLTSLEYLRQARDVATGLFHDSYAFAKAGVLIPVGLFGLSHGMTFPDLDISLLGIGYHRFFLFHSALGLVGLRYFYRQWLEKQMEPDRWANRVKRKISGALLGGFAVGVGVHLAIDVFQPKAVVFPFFGSLVDGTLVDDDIWLIANSLWAFKIAHDVFALSLADELKDAKEFVKKQFEARVEEWAVLREGNK